MGKHFTKVAFGIDIGDLTTSPMDLVQVADVHNRQRYKYTEWQSETAPPTPLLMYRLTDDVEKSILRQLPEALLAREVPGVYYMRMPKPCAESKALPPHVDRGRRAAINIYTKCGGETTQFFEADEGAKELRLVESFVANEGEAWLMDVSKPHAVLMASAFERCGVSLSFRKARFEELAKILGGTCGS
jgi:hypothetical protein